MKRCSYVEKITELYMYVSISDFGEGIVAEKITSTDGREMSIPFIGLDKQAMDRLKPIVKEISKDQGIKIKLIKLTHREEVEEFNP